MASQPSWGRPLRAGVPELAADLRARLPVHEVRDALPGRGVLVRIEPRAAGGDPALGADAGHLGGDEARSPLRPLGVVDQMPVPGEAARRLVLGHGRDDDPVLEPQPAEGEGREHRRADRGVRRPGPFLEPALGAPKPPGIAQAQVLVADPLRAGQQRVVEPARDRGRCTARRSSNQARELRAADWRRSASTRRALLVVCERLLQGRHLDQGLGEADRSLHRELGAGADREVGGGGGVPEEHDVPVGPLLAEHPREVEPRRAPQVGRVAHEGMPVEVRGEDPPAGLRRLGLAHRLEAEPFPGGLRAFHDEGGGARIELVGMRPDPAVPGLLEDEGEGVGRISAACRATRTCSGERRGRGGSARGTPRGRANAARRRRPRGRTPARTGPGRRPSSRNGSRPRDGWPAPSAARAGGGGRCRRTRGPVDTIRSPRRQTAMSSQ